MLLSWRKRQQGGETKTSRGARPAKPRKFRPLFETLENRVLLSVITINVTSNADQGGLPVSDGNNTFHGTLRQAINEANLAATSDGNSYLIKLQAGTTYKIASGGGTSEDMNAVGGDFDLTSQDAVTIQGANGPSGGSIIDGNRQDRVFDVATGNQLITFDTLTIQNGNADGDGGGLRTAPGTMVKLTNVIVQGNRATLDGGGIAAGYPGFSPSGGSGGISAMVRRAASMASGGSLTIVNSQILNNFAVANGVTSHGGGIALRNETANISGHSLISGNKVDGPFFSGGSNSGEGGGLYTGLQSGSGGTNVTVDDSTISDNFAFGGRSGGSGEGGGAWIGNGDTLTVQNGSVIGGPSGGNTAGAGPGFGGKGGGIYGDVGSTVIIGSATNPSDNSTVSYNLADGTNAITGGGSGGGLYSDGIVKLTNSTVSHNTAGAFGHVVFAIRPLITTTAGSGEGGGVFADGTSGGSFTSTNSHIDNNTAQGGTVNNGSGGGGGGIALVNENATILGGTVSNNTAEGDHNSVAGDGGKGGGIYTGGAVSGTTLNIGATADGQTVNPVTIAGNTAGGGRFAFSGGSAALGGGIFLGAGDTLKLTNSTVQGNQALAAAGSSGGGGVGGGIAAEGTNGGSGGSAGSVSIRYSTIDGNTAAAGSGSNPGFGGGIALAAELATIFGSTISNNHANNGFGGGIVAVGPRGSGPPNIMVTNSTIANNTANGGGGLYNLDGSVVQLTNDTVAFNQVASSSGGGGAANSGGTIIVWNTIIARNTFSGGAETDVSGLFTSKGHNLIGLANQTFSGGSNNGFSAAMGDQFSANSNAPLDPGLNPLANNGGPTLTCSLKVQPRSPAIDAGDDAALSVTGPYDQRGPGFPRMLGRHIDIGAFEARTSIRPGGDQ